MVKGEPKMNMQRGFLRLTVLLSIIVGIIGTEGARRGNLKIPSPYLHLYRLQLPFIFFPFLFAGSVWMLYFFIKYIIEGFRNTKEK